MADPARLVLQQILDHGATVPSRVALIHPRAGDDDGWGRVTYGELAARVHAVAAGLARRGVGRGARVVVLVPMSVELYVVLLAVASLGAVAVFVEPAATPKEMARAIRVTHPVAFIGVPKAHALRLMFPGATATSISVVVGPEADALSARLLGAEPLAAVEADGVGIVRPEVALTGADPALLTFSSGSTGVPKGAVRSHAFLGAQHEAMAGLLDAAGRKDGAPDVHMSAFAIVLLSTLVSGHTAVIPRMGKGVDDIDGSALAAAIRALGVTVISGSPAFLGPIVAAAARAPRASGLGPLADVRRIISGGAPVPVELCELAGQVLDPGATFLVVYGSTEAEPISRIDAAEVRARTAAQTRAGAGLCVGRPDPHVTVTLLRPEPGRPVVVGPGGIAAMAVADGEVGEVVVAGDHVNKRYFRDPAAERATKIVDERGEIWHRTGDAAYRDGEGRLWLVGRIGDIVHRGDAVYHPSAVEAAARTLPWVARAALVPDGAGGALLVVEPAAWSRRGRPAEVSRHLAERGVTIDRVVLTKKLPVDPRHRAKLDYPAVRRTWVKESRS